MKIASRHLPLFIIATISLASCSNYGEKVKKDFVEVYYKDNITKEQAEKTLELLYPGWNEPGNKKSVQLTKKADTVYFRMVINEEKARNIKDETYLLLGSGLSSSVFDNVPVNVDLTDDRFNTLRTLHFEKVETDALPAKSNTGNIEVYTGTGVSGQDATKLADYLGSVNTESTTPKSFRLEKDAAGVYVVSMVSSPELSQTLPEQEYYSLAQLISDNVFNGAALNLQLTDQNFSPYQTFRHKN